MVVSTRNLSEQQAIDKAICTTIESALKQLQKHEIEDFDFSIES